ncbi:MAG: hypothetical protein C0P78_000705 [Bacillota bacterium]
MRRWRRLALTAAVALAVGLAAALGSGVVFGPGLRPGGQRQEPADPYFPVELPPDVRGRLVVHDHAWPHPDPFADPNRFQGEQAETWAQRLDAAVAAFQRRFPGVEVVVEVRPFAAAAGGVEPGGRAGPAGPGGASPDVVAVWWGGSLPAAGDVVPLNRYLTPEIMAQYHPAAWPLVESGGVYWGWPRWIALHYWIAPRAMVAATDPAGSGAAAGSTGGWTLADALAAAGAGFLAPPASGGLLLELAAGTLPPPAPPGDAGEGGGMPGVEGVGEEAVTALAGALGRLRVLLTETAADPGRRLAEADFGLAAGFGPALGHWAVSPPLSGRGRPDGRTLELVPPPAVDGAPARLPVLSAGAYAVLRKSGPDEAVRAQLAVELARHLSAWQAEAPVARLLALPAHIPALERWRAAPPLPAAAAARLLDDLERSAAEGLRAYGRPDPAAAPLDPVLVRQWWREWLGGQVDDETLARWVLTGPARGRTAGGGDAP